MINTCAIASPIQMVNAYSTTFVPGKHQGAVTTLALDKQGYILSAGEDGFLEIWDIQRNTAVERFQVSSYPITAMVLRQNAPHIALVERSGNGIGKISAWDYINKQKLWTLTVSDTVSTVSYSATGSFLIIGENNRIMLIDPETGVSLTNVPSINAAVHFVATGKSEKTMVGYQNLGLLSYWNLSTGIEMQHFRVPAHLRSPILFGSNRFLAALDSTDLVIVNAVSGTEIARDPTLTLDMLISLDPDSTEFMGLNSTTVYRFALNKTGKLEIMSAFSLPREIPRITSALFHGQTKTLLVGTTAGTVWQLRQNNTAQVLYTQDQSRIIETAAAGNYFVFITEEQYAGGVPLDYNQLDNDMVLYLERTSLSRITAAPLVQDSEEPVHLLFWQTQNTRDFPLLVTINPDETIERTPLDTLQFQFPLQSIALLHDNLLFLDSMGNIQVLSIGSGTSLFTFSNLGLLDAGFWDEKTIIMARSSRHNEGMPFLRVDMITGETVPISLPDIIGIKLYRAASGTVYAAAVDERGSSTSSSTVLLRFDQEGPVMCAQTAGEDIDLSIAESAGILASTLGDEGVSLYNPTIPVTRTAGFPLTVVDGGTVFLALDKDGTVTWHDPYTGAVRALFRLYEDFWTLHRGDEILHGQVVVSNKIEQTTIQEE
ncbi:MAG: hypothetical protein LBO67_00510 [Spirochaetaceae bacterium]|nr:hypothetical protein [Spirochaetaceae bacterium]